MQVTNRYPVSCTLWTNVFPEAWRAPYGPVPYNTNSREVPCCCLTLGSSAPSSPTSSPVCVLFTGGWAALLPGQLLISPVTRQLRLGEDNPCFVPSRRPNFIGPEADLINCAVRGLTAGNGTIVFPQPLYFSSSLARKADFSHADDVQSTSINLPNLQPSLQSIPRRPANNPSGIPLNYWIKSAQPSPSVQSSFSHCNMQMRPTPLED